MPKSRSAVSALTTVISGGGQFAYNIGPKGDGSIDPFDQQVLDNIGAWMQRHPSAITGAKATWFHVPRWGRVTANGDALYFFVPNWSDGQTISLHGLANEVTSVTIDGTEQALEHSRDGLDLNVRLTGPAPDPLMSVVKVSLDGAPMIIPEESVAIEGRTATVTGTDVLGRMNPKGRNAFTAMDGYIVNPGADAVSVTLDVAATGIRPGSTYRVSLDGDSVVLTGEQLLAGAVPGSFVLDGESTGRIRIQYADPAYYADALAMSRVTFTAHTSTAGEATADLRAAVDGYVASGELAGPIAKQLSQALAQADKHLQEGRLNPGTVAVERALALVENPKRPDTLSPAAAADLGLQLEALLKLLRS